ncbi:MAG: DNA oxidative demethylase AlkB [Zoogloeaceae bacterium]|nr:DNA oxidative demethylase AlkB [Zoogloeaceae bacterium]
MISGDLFADTPPGQSWALAPGAWCLPARARDHAEELLAAVAWVVARAPFRHMRTPGGRVMGVGLTNCGALGWVSDEGGYRYTERDPLSGHPWPTMPQGFRELAAACAAEGGYPGFAPDACLINCYEPGVGLSPHQDRDEQDFAAPIVSVSLGLPAVFLFGGLRRRDVFRRLTLAHGDVVVWGGPTRLAYHGVQPLRDGAHAMVGRKRINLTFRQAG